MKIHFEAGKLKQEIKITVIDVSCKFIYKNYMTYTYYINLVEAIIRHQKFLLTCRELPTIALSYHVKIRENY